MFLSFICTSVICKQLFYLKRGEEIVYKDLIKRYKQTQQCLVKQL